MEFTHQSLLPFVGMSHEFVGAQHDTKISFFLVVAEPDGGPPLHRHKYDEVVYVISGRADWTVNGQEREAKAGDVFVVKAGEPHKFVSSHDDPVRQIDIHLNATFEQEALE